jgi:hypothetical protein
MARWYVRVRESWPCVGNFNAQIFIFKKRADSLRIPDEFDR